MTEETKNHITEIRIHFLKRQIKHATYTKNITACTSNLLKTIIALIRDNECYKFDPEKVREMETLYAQYQEQKQKRQSKSFILLILFDYS